MALVGGVAHLGCDTSETIVAPGRFKVCDGAHTPFVTNDVSLRLQTWDASRIPFFDPFATGSQRARKP